MRTPAHQNGLVNTLIAVLLVQSHQHQAPSCIETPTHSFEGRFTTPNAEVLAGILVVQLLSFGIPGWLGLLLTVSGINLWVCLACEKQRRGLKHSNLMSMVATLMIWRFSWHGLVGTEEASGILRLTNKQTAKWPLLRTSAPALAATCLLPCLPELRTVSQS